MWEPGDHKLLHPNLILTSVNFRLFKKRTTQHLFHKRTSTTEERLRVKQHATIKVTPALYKTKYGRINIFVVFLKKFTFLILSSSLRTFKNVLSKSYFVFRQ